MPVSESCYWRCPACYLELRSSGSVSGSLYQLLEMRNECRLGLGEVTVEDTAR